MSNFTIIRDPNPDPANRTKVPTEVLNDRTISLKATGIYIGICYLEQAGREVTVASLMALGREGRDAVRSGLRELVKAGHIEMPDDLPPARGKLDPLLWAQVVVRDGCRCRYCGRRIKSVVHIDHVFPLSRGGLDTIDNLVVACRTCNLKKHDRTPDEAGMLLREVSVV